MQVLTHADSLMEDYPDSAYAIISALGSDRFDTDEEEAYYSLLMSMAMDKQNIALSTDSIIAPASRYYRHHGSNDDRMRTAYYHARVLENSGDEKGAMKMLVDNLKLVKKSGYHLFKGRFYLKIARLYSNNYDFEPAYRYAREAKDEYRRSGRVKNYVTGLLATSTFLQQLKDFRAAEAELDTVRLYWASIDDHSKGEYYRQRINIERLFKDNSGSAFRDECLKENLAPEEVPYLTISFSFLDDGNAEEAEKALVLCSRYNPEYVQTQVFQYQLASLHIEKGDYERALKAERAYRILGRNKDMNIINSEVRLVEERHESRVSKNRDMAIILVLVASVLALCMCIILIVTLLQRKRRRVEALYSQLDQEKAELEGIIRRKILFDEDDINIINDRLHLINTILIARATGNISMLMESEKKLMDIAQDRGEMMLTTSSLFSCSYPEFISFLKSKGLTSQECGYCCMYLLGFNGKEINATLFKGSGYNYGSNVRKKLGLGTHEANLGIYLKGIASELDKN